MSDLGLSGIASGVDTSAIVEKLMAVERQGTTRLTLRQTALKAHQSDLRAIASKLNALRDAASALASSDGWQTRQSAESSDPSHVTATLLAGAGIGGHTVQVDRLASSAQHGYAWTAPGSATTLDLYDRADPADPAATKVTINVAANATAQDVATAINASQTAPVYASVITDSGGAQRLIFSSRRTGSGGDFSVGASPLATEDPLYARTGDQLNAAYRIDGEATARSAQSNSIDDALPGVRITLKGVTSAPATVTVASATIDKSAVTAKIKAFVDAYNAVVDATRSQLNEKRVPNATTADDVVKGQLFGDVGLSSMLSQLRSQMRQTLSGLTGVTSLSDLGIGVPKGSGGLSSDDAIAGKLVIDSEKLSDALDADWTKVRDLFAGAGATQGLGTRLFNYARAQSGTGGVLEGRIATDDTAVRDLSDQLARTNQRLSAEETRLKAQFAAMESALQNAQTQQAWLQGQLASLS